MSKGVIRIPDPVTEEVLAVIAGMGDQEVFRPREVAAKIPHRTYHQVRTVIRNKTRQGALDRVGYERYQKGGTRVKTTLPKGLVVEATWAVLFTSPHPMRLAEITGEVESYIGRPISLHGPVSYILYTWYRDGHLARFGEKLEYRYSLKSGITERPICNYYAKD